MQALTDRSPSQSGAVHLVLPSEIAYLGVLGDCINEVCGQLQALKKRTETNPDQGSSAHGRTLNHFCHDVHLAVHEAAVNIIEHAYQGQPGHTIEVTFLILADELRVTLRDHGAAFNPDQVPEPNLKEPQEGGLGVYLIRKLMDQVDYQRDAQGNVLTMVKRFQESEESG